MLELIPKIPQYLSTRRFGWPCPLPLNLVVSVTFRCNSRCKTCNIWKRTPEDSGPELALEEYDQVFAQVGKVPYYITFSGGEPFLRRDIADVVASAYRHCRPSVITIPTNGILWKVVPVQVERIAAECKDSDVIINLSLDGLGPMHDEIRGIEGNYELSLKALEGLKEVRSRHRNLSLGLHTVVSRFNLDRIPDLISFLGTLGADSIVTEVAEQRAELSTLGAEIAPSASEYEKVADFLVAEARKQRPRGVTKLTRAFRIEYYGLASRILRESRQVLPCYAGFASAHIAPDGEVWACCTRAETMGNLREVRYDLGRVWRSAAAEAMRKGIASGSCFCPMANMSYTNMLLDVPTVFRVALRSVMGR